MRTRPAQVLPLILVLGCLFGCKAGPVFRVAAAVAITTARVVAAASAQAQHEQAMRQATAQREPASSFEGANLVGGCTELQVDGVASAGPGSAPARVSECGNEVLIQDEDGHWRRYHELAAPAEGAP